jgi:hypothetical protein
MPASPPPAPTPLERSGSFSGADDFHFGRGTARLIETGPGTYIVRFEDFSVRNGPDLFVYLSPDPAGYADGAIELGRLRATDGSFNTPVPDGADVSAVRSVVIWCKEVRGAVRGRPAGGLRARPGDDQAGRAADRPIPRCDIRRMPARRSSRPRSRPRHDVPTRWPAQALGASENARSNPP